MDEANAYRPDGKPLRRGWTTGACATAATRSALSALLSGRFEDPVSITLPGGQTPSFALAHEAAGVGFAEAGIVKDAGDDPDVTHGALVIARVAPGAARGLLEALASDACLVVTDLTPAFFFPAMRAAAARRISRRLEAVDGVGLLPVRVAGRGYLRAFEELIKLHLCSRGLM